MSGTHHAGIDDCQGPPPCPHLPPHRENLDWLETRFFLAFYLVVFFLKLAATLGVSIYFFYRDMTNIKSPKAGVVVDDDAEAVAIIFFLLQLGATIVFFIFLLVEAFRVKTVVVRGLGGRKKGRGWEWGVARESP